MSRTGLIGWALLATFAGSGAAALPESPFRVLPATRRSPPFLDAAPVCIPSELTGGDAVSAQLRAGDVLGALRTLARLEPAADPAARAAQADLSALKAIVAARTAANAEREAAWLALRRVAETDARPRVRACALLERARLSLLEGRTLDARIDRDRARRSGDLSQWPPQYGLIASWLEAEEAHRTGNAAAASERWQQIAGGADARLALAARLRLVEASFPVAGESSGDAAAAWKAFPALLESASAAHLDIEPWSLVAGELALRAGDLQGGHHWLARAELAWRGGLASIRKADALVALGRTTDARNTLAGVVRRAREREVRDLAELRIAQLDLDAGKLELALDHAQEPARSLHPFVRGEALLLIGRAQLAAGRPAAALESYVRVARSDGEANRELSFRTSLESTLRALTAENVSCAAVLQRLGSRAEFLVRSSDQPDALLRVGDCFLQLEMPGAALDSYRTASRRFGQDADAALSLRIATAALAAGELDTVRSAVDAALAKPSEPADDAGALRWRWLAFALAEREGRASDGLAQLAQLARSANLPSDLRGGVERALLTRFDWEGQRDGARAALEASIAIEPALASPERGYSWLRLADLALAAGETAAAQAAYARAAELLGNSVLRARALHHGALLQATKQRRREALGIAAASKPGSAWNRVAGLELRLQRLAEQVEGSQARTP